jgi:hypothetical protein
LGDAALFGDSAPTPALFELFGVTVDAVVQAARRVALAHPAGESEAEHDAILSCN